MRKKLHLSQAIPAGFRLIRLPNLMILFVSMVVVRQFIIAQQIQIELFYKDLPFLLLGTATCLIAAAGYIINDYYDIKIDLINKPKRVVIGEIFTRRIALVAHFILNAIAILIAAFLGIKILISVFVASVLMWEYANRFKRLALWGNLLIALLSGFSLYFISFLYPTFDITFIIIYALFAVISSLIREIIKDIEDMKGDEAFGCKTLPIQFGVKTTKNIIYTISIGFIGICIYLLYLQAQNTALFLYIGLLVLPIFLTLLFFLYRAKVQEDYTRLSNWSKLLMVLGILSMFFLQI